MLMLTQNSSFQIQNLQKPKIATKSYKRFNELTLPLVGASSAIIIFIAVVFPAPVWPNRPKTSPASMAKHKFLTANLELGSTTSFLLQQSLNLVEFFMYSFLKF